MIEIRHASKGFQGKSVLKNINLAINTGDLVYVIGRSGSGKSVLLKSIVGLLPLDSGEIWIDEIEISRFSEEELHPIRKRCGYVFQKPALLDSLSVYENLAFGLKAYTNQADRDQKIKASLAMVQLGEKYLLKYPPELSFGLLKRVSIARALVRSPDALLFDEPTTGLDPALTRVITDLISKLTGRQKMTGVVVSHDLHCALSSADRIVLLEDGKVALDATPVDFQKSKVPLAMAFLKEANLRSWNA